MWNEAQLSDLLLLLEERSGQCPTRSVRSLCDDDSKLRAELDAQPELREELERRLAKLRSVDQVIAGAHAVPAAAPHDIPGYEIHELVGRGGMGVVYRARDVKLNRTVALKILLAGPFCSRTALARFHAEAEAIARLAHPGFVQIYEMGDAAGVPFLALEYVAGANFKEKIAGRPMEPRAAADWVCKISRAVQYAHDKGIVHRDLKPSNILITRDGEPKIADFGLAKYLKEDQSLTRSGEVPGTPSYMAPEQVAGRAVGPGTDVYALGAMLYECLTGRPPFLGPTTGETLLQVRDRDPVPPSRLQPKLPRELEAICLCCLEKEPAGRYSSAAALADDLERWIAGRVTRVRPAGPAVRAWKWTRRRPALASLIAVSIAAVCAIAGISVAYVRHLRDSRATAEALRADAESSKALSQQQAYAATIRTAQWAWESFNRPAFLELLASYGQSDLPGFEWHYLQHLSRRGTTRLRPQQPIEVDGVAFSPDGQKVATANRDGTIDIWSHPAGEHLKSFRAHDICANLLRYSPDGRLLATASCDTTIRLWDSESLEMVREIRSPGGPVRMFRFDPAGEKIYTAGDEPLVRTWSVTTGASVGNFQAGPEALHCLALSSDGRLLAAGGDSTSIVVWDAESSAQLGALPKAAGTFAMRFLPGEPLLAIAEPNAVRVVSVPEGQPRYIISTHGLAHCLAMLKDAQVLYCATDRGVLDVWDRGRNAVTGALPLHAGRITDAAVSPDNRYLLTSSIDHTAVILQLTEPDPAEPFERVPLPSNNRCAVALNAQAGKLAIAWGEDQGGRVTVSDVGGMQSETQLPRSASWPVDQLVFSLDGHFLTLHNAANDNPDEIWRITGARPVLVFVGKSPQPIENAGPRDYGRLLRPEGNALRVVDARSESLVAEVPVNSGAHSFEFLRGDRWITYLVENHACFINLPARQTLRPFPVSGRANTLQLSAQGEFLAVGSVAGAHLFAFPSGTQMHNLLAHEGSVNALAFSPDSKTLATGGDDHTVRLWNVSSGQEMLTLKGHTAPVRALAFSKDGKVLMSMTGDGRSGTPVELFRWRAQ